MKEGERRGSERVSVSEAYIAASEHYNGVCSGVTYEQRLKDVPDPQTQVIRTSECPTSFTGCPSLRSSSLLQRQDVVNALFAHESPWVMRLAYAHVVCQAKKLA